MLGLSPVPGRVEAGVLLHLEIRSPHSVTSVAARAARLLGEIVGLGLGTDLAVATMSSPRSGVVSLGNLTDDSLATLCDPGDAFFIRSVGPDRLEVTAEPLGEGAWSLAVLAAAAIELGDDERLNQVVDVVRNLAPQARLISGGADIQPLFDHQHHSMFPYGRGKIGWERTVKEHRICGYYWLTLLGPDIARRLPEPPPELMAASTGHCLAIQLGESAEHDDVVRSQLPTLRDWLLPVLPGWMAGRDPGFQRDYLKGQLFQHRLRRV